MPMGMSLNCRCPKLAIADTLEEMVAPPKTPQEAVALIEASQIVTSTETSQVVAIIADVPEEPVAIPKVQSQENLSPLLFT